jgi:hypothetical protein
VGPHIGLGALQKVKVGLILTSNSLRSTTANHNGPSRSVLHVASDCLDSVISGSNSAWICVCFLVRCVVLWW